MSLRDLNSCPACQRQYDVTHVQAGEGVRCECSHVFAARHHPARAPRMLRCSNCGGVLRSEATRCEYCAAELRMEDRGQGVVCPACYARASLEARFCAECGLSIEPQALAAIPADARCPRCEGGLRSRVLESATVIECTGCGGLWLEPQVFEDVKLAAKALGPLPIGEGPSGPFEVPDQDGKDFRYLPCLRCEELMVRRSFGRRSGVIIDFCRKHGVWLDSGELSKIVTLVRVGRADAELEADQEPVKVERPLVDWTPTRPVRGPVLFHILWWLADVLKGSLR